MEENPRHAAVQILNNVDDKKAYAEPLLDSYLSNHALMNDNDRRLLTQLVYGTLRLQKRLDWVIAAFYRGTFSEMETGLKNILRTALLQISEMDRIPPFAAVDEAVKLAKKLFPGRSSLVNAVLRNAIRGMSRLTCPDFSVDPLRHISIMYSHPEWIVSFWIDELGVEETRRLCESNNEIPSLILRVNGMKMTRDEALAALAAAGLEAEPTRFSPDGIIVSRLPGPIRDMALFRDGCIQIQDEASQLVSHLVDPGPGERVLDLCAGTGIKTTHLAEMMRNEGSITAVDISGHKLDMLRSNARRLGISIIHTCEGDATGDIDALCSKSFDRILVDVPCSGLGTLRRNPEIKWHRERQDLENMAALQKKILHNALSYLKEKGILVYSTCTISSPENDKVVGEFLDTHPGYHRAHPPDTLSKEVVDTGGYFRTSPHHHGTDGFFGVILKGRGT